MFWDVVAPVYNFYENIYNGKVNKHLQQEVAALIHSSDRVLECACGAGMLSVPIAKKCRELIATDCSTGMLKQVKRVCKNLPNVQIKRANIMQLSCKDASFDKVVAGNVIHLLDNPSAAIAELLRVCKPGGKLIIPTYINIERDGNPDAEYVLVDGKMPCAIAIITKEENVENE